MSRVLVTGGAGFIGSHLVDALLKQRHQITVVDDLSSGHRENLPDGVELIREDIRSPRMKDIWRDVRPEYVFHLAAQKNVRTSINEPLLDAEINITGSLNVIELSRQFKVKKFIFASTGGVYAENIHLPADEKAKYHPGSPYVIAKLAIEQYLEYFRLQRGLNSTILRFANVFGPRQDPRGEAGVVAIFIERVLRDQSLEIFGNGKQTRDFIYVDDVIRAAMMAMKKTSVVGALNIGTGKQTSINKLADEVMKIAKHKVSKKRRSIIFQEATKNALNPKLARKKLGWKSETQLTQGLRETINSFLAQ